MKSILASLLAGLALSLPAAASAQQLAFTAKTVNLRAGPDRMYPIVLVLPPATQVVVQGCMSDYRWCDVSIGYERGWVYAGNLRYTSTQGYVPFVGIAPVLGITILSFGIHDYWGSHYRDRPWYGDRHRWDSPPRPHVRPPAPRLAPQPAPIVRPRTPDAPRAPHAPNRGREHAPGNDPRHLSPGR